MRSIDSFWINLCLSHPNCDPLEITNSLGLTPWFSAQAGQELGSILRKSSVWMHHLRADLSAEAFGEALESFVALLTSHTNFLSQFVYEGGEIRLEINQTVGLDDGVLFQLGLEPSFLQTCGTYGVGLKIQAWSSDKDILVKNLSKDLVAKDSY